MELLVPERRADPDLRALYDVGGPYVRGGMLQSADGTVAHDGSSRPLQRPGDLLVFRTLRQVADVVLVGAGTARDEDYGPVVLDAAARAWRAERGRRADVPLAVVSARLDVPPASRWLLPGALVVTCASAPSQARARLADQVEVLVCGEEAVDLALAVDRLAERGLSRVLCEGGPTLLGALVQAGLLTELCATVAPVLAGAGPGMLARPLPDVVDLHLEHLLREQDTLLGRWTVRPPA